MATQLKEPDRSAPAIPLSDCTWDETPIDLRVKVRDLLYKLTCDIEALGDASPYYSVIYFTPQGNAHTAYANGKVKEQGASAYPIKCADFSGKSQFEAFEDAASALLETIAHDKPQGRDRLIWRHKPEASRELHEDGLYIKIYTRIGWDKSEGK